MCVSIKTLLQGVLNTFVVFLSRIIGHIIDRTVFKTRSGHGPAFWIVSIVCQIVLGLLATIIMMWFSRYREFRADAGGAALAGSTLCWLDRQKTQMTDEKQRQDEEQLWPVDRAVVGVPVSR